MIIGLISDTHVPEAMPEVPREVEQAFRGVDLILHAGDMHVIGVLDWLERIAPVLSVRGNGDYATSYGNYNANRPGVPDDPRVLEHPVLHYEGHRVGLTHAFPGPEEVSWEDLDRLMHRFFGQAVDVVVTGDSHVEEIIDDSGLFLVNPGSPTLPRNLMTQLGTVGLMELNEGQRPRAEIIDLKTL